VSADLSQEKDTSLALTQPSVARHAVDAVPLPPDELLDDQAFRCLASQHLDDSERGPGDPPVPALVHAQAGFFYLGHDDRGAEFGLLSVAQQWRRAG